MLAKAMRLFSYKLFTPGPLSTTHSVKSAIMQDLGSSKEFSRITSEINADIIKISKLSPDVYTSILLPGSGTFGVEATLRTAIKRSQKVLIIANGAYGERMIKMCTILGIPHKILRYSEREKVKSEDVLNNIEENITHVAMVHSETTTGILNPIDSISLQVKNKHPNIVFIGDCVSSFGAVDADFSSIDYIITCSNKLLQGIPGLALIVANKEKLLKCKDNSQSAMLDLYRIYTSDKNFITMPPYQSVYGLKQAIEEF